jgi:hypothetical protein
VLRDHLGDECLGLAGGVLYEMIEVDCQHSDDPGAAFQRWRHDHMNRHTDLELPHVPHLTTVTSAVTPTATLVRWRKEHPQRYRTRLSDHSSRSEQAIIRSSCIRSRKEWMIEHTMYVSSRNGGTHPLHHINAKEFHERQWSGTTNHIGKLIGEKSLNLVDLLSVSEPDQPAQDVEEARRKVKLTERIQKHRGDTRYFFQKVLALKRPFVDPTSTWLAPSSEFSTQTALRTILEPKPCLRVHDWEIPNANFARKFDLYTDSGPLPPTIQELPVAEDKAIDVVTDPTMQELMYSLGFQGPFTPQLWFDSGLDYLWRHV